MTVLRHLEGPANEAAIWQDVEFGAYSVDLPLWEELARNAGGTVVELGAGSGRVTLHLARAGVKVLAVERDQDLMEELTRRAEGLPIEVATADIGKADRSWVQSAPRDTRLVIAPLQFLQLLDAAERRQAIAAASEALPSGGRFAVSLVDETTLVDAGVAAAPKPDMREVDGWVYFSEPLWVQVSTGSLRMRRLRERVSPGGDLVRRVHDEVLHRVSPDEFEREAREAGLSPAGRRKIRSGPNEADSTVVLLEKAP